MRDPGIHWIKIPDVMIAPDSALDHLGVLTPRVVALPRGGFRMFYMGKSSDCSGRILSACSPDLRSWEKEPGIRLDVDPGKNIVRTLSPDIVSVSSDRHRMYFEAHYANGKAVIMSALSHDLFHWEMEEGVRISSEDNNHGAPKCVCREDNSFRLYFHEYPQPMRSGLDAGNVIVSAVSKNGLDFMRDEGIRINQDNEKTENYAVYAPEIVPLEDAALRMYYAAWIDAPHNEPCGQIVTAVSHDGLAWMKDDAVVIPHRGTYDYRFASEPCIIESDKGCVMMFYEACDADRVYRIMSAAAVS